MKALLVLLIVSAVTATASAQTLDRIVAVVGTRPILASQIEEEMVQQQAQGQTLPTDSAALATLRRQVLDRLVELEILVQQAERDTSIKVTDQEVLRMSASNSARRTISAARFARRASDRSRSGGAGWPMNSGGSYTPSD